MVSNSPKSHSTISYCPGIYTENYFRTKRPELKRGGYKEGLDVKSGLFQVTKAKKNWLTSDLRKKPGHGIWEIAKSV